MFHRVKDVCSLPDFNLCVMFMEGITKVYDVKPLFNKIKEFKFLKNHEQEFYNVSVDTGGFGIVWNDELDLSCDELWDNGELVKTPFDDLISFSDASKLWNLNESTLRKAVNYGKLVNGVDVKKLGNQWVITLDSMKREYGEICDLKN